MTRPILAPGEVMNLGSARPPVRALMTVPDVAALLRVKPSTVRAYAERGVLPCVRVGGRLRFLPSDISEWIESRHSKGVT